MWFKETIRQYYSLILKHHKRHKVAYTILYAIFAYIISYIVWYIWLKYTIYVWIGIGIIVLIGYAFIIATVKYYRKMATIISIFLFLFGIFIYFYNPDPLIFELTKGYSLSFKDEIKNGNLSMSKEFQWIYKQDGFENGKGKWIFADSLTIKSWAYPERKNAIYQDIRKYNDNYILIGKFYLKGKNSIGLDFIKEIEPWTSGSSYQSCGITTQNWLNWAWFMINNSSNYIDFFNGKKLDYTEAQKGKFTEWTYYILAKIENWKLSCLYQKEWEDSYNSIVSNVWLKMNELAGPKLIKYSNTDEPKPYLLDFWIYSK